MSFGDAIDRLVRAYRGSLLLPNAQAIDYTRDVVSQGEGGHGKHGTTTVAPTYGDDAPLSVELERMAERLATVAERKLQGERGQLDGGTVPHDRRSSTAKAESAAVLRQLGDPTEVAYLTGRTTEGVRKLRQRNGLDPETGERVPERPLTAPARDQLQHHERTTTTED